MKFSIRKGTAAFLLVAFAVISAVGVWTAMQQLRDYREKMDIIYTMVAAERRTTAADSGIPGQEAAGEPSESEAETATESRLPAGAAEEAAETAAGGFGPAMESAARLLKGTSRGAEAGENLLAGFGYGQELFGSSGVSNRYRDELLRSWSVTLLLCLAGFAVLALVWVLLKRRSERGVGRCLNEISSILSDLQAGQYDAPQRYQRPEGGDASAVLYDRFISMSEHLRYAESMSQREKEMTKSLVTDLSHQLKTPVAALGTSLEILGGQDLSEEERAEFTSRCLEQQVRLRELLNALINISRLETGMIAFSFAKARLFDTVGAAVSRIYPLADRKNIAISVEAEDSLGDIEIRQDAKWLCEALINVLENAVKYSPEGTEIQIRVVRMITFLRIEIEDEGIGIPREERNRIFQRFYRGSEDDVQRQAGSGVGLYLTRKIVEAHGGMIRAADGHGDGAEGGRGNRGTVFIIQLPCDEL